MQDILKLIEKFEKLVQRESAIDADIQRLQAEAKDVATAIVDIRSEILRGLEALANPATHPTESTSNIQKARNVLRSMGSCAPLRVIVNNIAHLDLRGNDEEYNRQLMATLSSSLNSKVKKGVLFNRYKPYDGSEWVYGLIEWFGVDGIPHESKQVRLF